MPVAATSTDNHQIAMRVRASVSGLTRQLRSALPEEGISLAGLSVLGLLHRHGKLTPSEVARHEGVKQQSLTRLLAELESAGWLQRKPHETDGRQSVLSLSAKGTKLLAAHVHRREVSLANAVQDLSAKDREVLLNACALLDRLAASVRLNAGEDAS